MFAHTKSRFVEGGSVFGVDAVYATGVFPKTPHAFLHRFCLHLLQLMLAEPIVGAGKKLCAVKVSP